jgi:hypothetical protein
LFSSASRETVIVVEEDEEVEEEEEEPSFPSAIVVVVVEEEEDKDDESEEEEEEEEVEGLASANGTGLRAKSITRGEACSLIQSDRSGLVMPLETRDKPKEKRQNVR